MTEEKSLGLQTIDIKVAGVHDLFFVFKGKAPSQMMYFDY
jgi:hypothetical protein